MVVTLAGLMDDCLSSTVMLLTNELLAALHGFIYLKLGLSLNPPLKSSVNPPIARASLEIFRVAQCPIFSGITAKFECD